MAETRDVVSLYEISEFLNGEGCFMSAFCKVDTYYKDEEKLYPNWVTLDSRLKLSNGATILELYLDTYNKDKFNKSVEMLDKIAVAIISLRDAMIIGYERKNETQTVIDQQVGFEETGTPKAEV